MVQVRQMLVSDRQLKVKCPYEMQAESYTVHNTYNDASADNEVAYMIRNHHEVSFHYAIDDIEAVQGIPENRNAWAAGDGAKGTGNRKSIHIEICYSKSGGERYRKAEQNAIKFLAQGLKAKGWGIDRVKKHQDWSGKNCPHRILDEGRWKTFLAEIEKELNRIKGVVPVSKPAQASKVDVKIVDKSEYVGKKLIVKNDGLWFYNEPRWEICDGTSDKGHTFTIVEELIVDGRRMVKCHDGKYRTADPNFVDITPKPLDWPYSVRVENITHKEAQEIVRMIQSRYKAAKVYGAPK